MNANETETLTAAESGARDAVRDLAVPVADPAFRARLREQFVTDRFVPASSRVVRLPWHRRPMTSWTLAAAAAVIAVVSALALNQGPAWQVVSGHGAGIASVDGRSVSLGHTGDLVRRIHAGAHVTLPTDSDLELRAGGSLLMQIAPGSELVIPTVPGRWFMRRSLGELRSGEVRITTGPEFHGSRLALATPEARVLVTGTTLAVICDSTGTCVCVLDGAVRVGATGDSMPKVEAGMRAFVYADGRPMVQAGMRPEEIPELRRMRDSRTGSPHAPGH
ncbi:MAG: FecR domain-containing protein [Candidatus Eisenbacteria bacterium]|nr:FecR domain-containing protein [Candidatus Eisenbacteria bacterium]